MCVTSRAQSTTTFATWREGWEALPSPLFWSVSPVWAQGLAPRPLSWQGGWWQWYASPASFALMCSSNQIKFPLGTSGLFLMRWQDLKWLEKQLHKAIRGGIDVKLAKETTNWEHILSVSLCTEQYLFPDLELFHWWDKVQVGKYVNGLQKTACLESRWQRLSTWV